jgi:quercetin dioxygenase-like cupin family protein
MHDHPCLARFGSMEWESPAQKVRRKLHQNVDRQLRIVEFAQGLEHPEWCETGHIGYVLEGTMALEFDDQTVEVGPGEGFIIPDGPSHRHRPIPLTDHVRLVLSEQLASARGG